MEQNLTKYLMLQVYLHILNFYEFKVKYDKNIMQIKYFVTFMQIIPR